MNQYPSSYITLGIIGQVSQSWAIATVGDDSNPIYITSAAGMEWRAMPEGAPRARVSHLLENLTGLLRLPDRRSLINQTKSLAVALAGIDVRFPTNPFIADLRNLGFTCEDIVAVSLAEAAYWGAFQGRPGVLIRCGDDCSAYIQPTRGEPYLLGGWGTEIDRGTGPWLGRKALIAATRTIDGGATIKETEFVFAISRAYNLPKPVSLLEEFERHRYAQGELGTRLFLYKLGEHTIKLAEQGNDFAKSLVDRAIQQIVEVLLTSLQKLETQETTIDLCFRGGLLERHSFFCARLAARLVKEFPRTTLLSTGCTGGYSAAIGIGLISRGLRKSSPKIVTEAAQYLAENVIYDKELVFSKRECCLLKCLP